MKEKINLLSCPWFPWEFGIFSTQLNFLDAFLSPCASLCALPLSFLQFYLVGSFSLSFPCHPCSHLPSQVKSGTPFPHSFSLKLVRLAEIQSRPVVRSSLTLESSSLISGPGSSVQGGETLRTSTETCQTDRLQHFSRRLVRHSVMQQILSRRYYPIIVLSLKTELQYKRKFPSYATV